VTTSGAWRHARSIAVLPGTVAVLVPAFILTSSGGWTPPYFASEWLRSLILVAGAGLIALGLALATATVALFARSGKGTLAPWDPTSRLVVEGVYRHSRNPMITGVMLILLGEALVFASAALFIWFAAFTIVNAVYIPALEEPGLLRRFGDEYREYQRNVPRWIPRRRAWRPVTGR
jgi:protein-S-isoprenylcysteine O-methyltransferase Ste14